MDAGAREGISSSGQLEDWAAGVAADLKEEQAEEEVEASRRRSVDRVLTSPQRDLDSVQQYCAVVKRSRQRLERDSSPDDNNSAKDGPRPKLPRYESIKGPHIRHVLLGFGIVLSLPDFFWVSSKCGLRCSLV